MAVRSISASISACAARTAPRTISSVTASQAVGAFLREASGMGRSYAVRGGRPRGGRRRSTLSGGVSSAQRGKACGQRSRKEQPRGGSRASGTLPLIGSGCARLVGVRHRHGGDQRPRVGMARPAHDLVGRAVFDDAAEIHHQGALAEVTHQREVVGDVDGAQAHGVAHLAHQGQDAGAHADIEHRHRLVGHQEARRQHQSARQHDALQLAAAQLVRILVEIALEVGQVDAAERRGDAVGVLGRGRCRH